MKKIVLLFLLPILCWSNEIKNKPTTKEVTVYLTGAQITAESSVNVKAGSNTIILTDLSTLIDESSIQVSGLLNASIQSIGFTINHLTKKNESEAIKALENELITNRRIYASIESKIKGLEEEESLLANNKKLASEQQAITLEKMTAFSKYYRERIAAIKLEMFDLRKELAGIQETLNRLMTEKSKLENINHLERGEIILKIDSQKAQALVLTIKYNVSSAGWIPTYEIKANAGAKNLEFQYKANVFQETGDDWNNVKITLSTGDPNVNSFKPTPEPQYLNFVYDRYKPLTAAPTQNYKYNPMVQTVTGIITEMGQPLPGVSVIIPGTNEGTQTDFDGRYQIKVKGGKALQFQYIGMKTQVLPIYSSQMNVTMEADAQMLESVVVTAYSGRSKRNLAAETVSEDEIKYSGTGEIKEQNQTAVSFKINKPYTIVSSSESTIIAIDQFEIPTQFEYFAMPILNENVFLTAKIKDWEQYDFLAGEANIYLEGSYAGKTFINPFQTEEELVISMGVDPNVVVERKQINAFKDKSFLGSTRIIDKKYEITIRNNKTIPVEVKLYDRIPISQNKEIKVDKQQFVDGKINEEDGIVIWNIQLEGKNSTKKTIGYEIKYPKNQRINL
uniref:mucoidy inhibitor MuiA family protein n=1 Tax=Flavobacterium sp. TaxID=239 RepID=UPI00404B3C14